MGTDPDDPRHEGDGVFEWLGHEREPDAAPPAGAAADDPVRHEWTTPAPTHARLDPLTVQGVVNRALVVVFCLIAIGATFETVRTLSSSRVPRSTAVTPATIDEHRAAPTTLPHVTVPVPQTTPQTSPPRTITPATTPPATEPPATSPPQTTPQTSPPRTTPQTTPRTTPQTAPPPVHTESTTPRTTPTQTIQVPSTPTTQPTGIVVPVGP